MKWMMKSAWRREHRLGNAAESSRFMSSAINPAAALFYSRFYSRRIEKPV